MNSRRYALAAALVTVPLAACIAATGASSEMPDWSGQWQQVGAMPSPDGGFYKSLDQVLKEMQWSPPNKPAALGSFHPACEIAEAVCVAL